MTRRWILLLLLLATLFVANLSLGSVPIPLPDILRILTGQPAGEPIWTDIVWDFRLTKALTCVLAGGALAVGGLQMQTLFRNALAGPDVLGLTSGASLIVSLVFMGQTAGIALPVLAGPWTVALAASLGSTLVFLIMITVARHLRDNVSLLIVGLMIGAATSSVVSVLQFMSRAEELQTYMIWTFGSLGNLSWPEIQVLTILLMLGAALAIYSIKPLNAWFLGDYYAESLGINLRRSRIMIILSASILTGAVTAFCGPLAFVGLAVPHLVKLVVKSHNHKVLIPACLIGGGVLMLFCDIVGQLPGRTQLLPINAITALIGAPVVIWIILRNKKITV